MDETVHSLFDLDEHAEVGEVADFRGVAAADGVFGLDVLPGIFLKLLETEAHLARSSRSRVRTTASTSSPALRKSCALRRCWLQLISLTWISPLHAGLYLYESTVVGHNHYAALTWSPTLRCLVQIVPGMGYKLLDTESDALLLVVEVEDNDLDVLIKLNNLVGIRNTTPAEVGDVDETVHAAEVHEANTP